MLFFRRLLLIGLVISVAVPRPVQARAQSVPEIFIETLPLACGLGIVAGVATYAVLTLETSKNSEDNQPTREQKLKTSAKIGLYTFCATATLGVAFGLINNALEQEDAHWQQQDDEWREFRGNQNRFFRQEPEPDHYAVLGLRAGATFDEVKRAFRRLALTCHPDKFPGDRAKEEQFKAINNAYEALCKHFGQR